MASYDAVRSPRFPLSDKSGVHFEIVFWGVYAGMPKTTNLKKFMKRKNGFFLAVCLAATLVAATIPEAYAQSVTEAIKEVAADAAASKPQDQSLLALIQKGGWCMVPLGALSAFTVGYVFYCFLSLRRNAVVTSDFLSAIEAYLQKRDLLGLVAHSTKQPESLARIVQTTLQFATRNPSAKFALLKEIAETEGSRQASRMFQQVSYLYDIGVVAPMFGLAGTVTGMITSFNVIGLDPSNIRPAMLANGVAEALIATAAGLVIGIPAMVFYSFFKGRAQFLAAELEAQSTSLLAHLEVQQDKQDNSNLLSK